MQNTINKYIHLKHVVENFKEEISDDTIKNAVYPAIITAIMQSSMTAEELGNDYLKLTGNVHHDLTSRRAVSIDIASLLSEETQLINELIKSLIIK